MCAEMGPPTQIFRRRASILALIGLLVPSIAALAQSPRAVINVPVANMFSGPSADVDVVSQAIYGSSVDVLEEKRLLEKIRTPWDGYTGWVSRSDLLNCTGERAYATTGEVAIVEELAAHLYRDPDLTLHAPALTVPFETRLEVVEEKPGGSSALCFLRAPSWRWRAVFWDFWAPRPSRNCCVRFFSESVLSIQSCWRFR